ncbi:hypothetical protein [Duganella fentianensis]|uniref:AbrB/MazE/SpoVT family DNA-binding domain-containing protein n=1 Tax=Duganella fentianensis TaxID=2692177 RepID=UPI0032B28987
MDTQVTLVLQKIGEHLALCIPSEFAQLHRLTQGQSLTVTVPERQAKTAAQLARIATLEQMLALFDPDQYGGEYLPSTNVGCEIIK